MNFVRELWILLRKEFTTDLGRFNIRSCVLLGSFFIGSHFLNFMKQLINLIFHEDITVGNEDKLLYFMLAYFLISLILIAFKRKN